MKTQEKSDRERAIEWWLSIYSTIKRVTLQEKYFGTSSLVNRITNEEIEQIWRKETQQEKEEMPQVDFELLSLSVIAVSSNLKLTKKANLNLKLFFDLLSKSSTFAHKAHKELNKLTK